MNELIKIESQAIGGNTQPAVDARELHGLLQVKRKFNGWIDGRINDYEFKEGSDYVKTRSLMGPNFNRFEVKYTLTTSMAKELCMLERNEMGRQARRYFIEVEEKHKSRPQDARRFEMINVATPLFSNLKIVAREFGLESNQALLYANKATLRETGVDFQNVLQIELKSEAQIRQFTPTELGERLGLSAVKFNRQLESLGLQEKKNGVWCATEKGKPFSVLLDAGKKHSDGTPIQQLKWLETVLQFFQPLEKAI